MICILINSLDSFRTLDFLIFRFKKLFSPFANPKNSKSTNVMGKKGVMILNINIFEE